MGEHQCDKGPLIERMITQLDKMEAKLDELLREHTLTHQALMGNGTPGIADRVEEHADRLDKVETQMITADALKGLWWKFGGMLVGAVGLAATVISIIQALGVKK